MRYRLRATTVNTTAGSPFAEFIAPRRAVIREISLLAPTTAAYDWRLGRTSGTTAGGTAQTASAPENLKGDGGASQCGIITAGWSTAPAVPAAGNTIVQARNQGLSTASGMGPVGFTLSYWKGELVCGPRPNGLVWWSLNAVIAGSIFEVAWDE